MIFTIFALAGVLIFTWVWVIRGFFSAFLHMLCVLAAGAVAFAVYEPITMLLLSQAPDRGFGTILRDTAHGISLGMSFALSLVILRLAVDKAVPNNLKFNDNVEYVGAGVCGLATGIVTVGFLLMSLGMMRFGPDKPVQGLVFTDEGGGARGSVVRNSSPFRPYVDEWTAKAYLWMSRGTLATGEPLAKWHPNFHEQGSAMRTTFAGQSRNSSKPEEFKLIQWYALGDIERGGSMGELMRDRWQPGIPQRVIGLDGEEITNGYVAGVVLELDAQARELGGGAKIVLGNAQIRMVAEQDGTGFTRAFHPSAVISQADAQEPTLARFRFDAKESFIASVGGGAKAIMAFEFALPRAYRPIAVYVRGARIQLDKEPDSTFSTTTARDDAVTTLEYGGVDLADMDYSQAVELRTMNGRQELEPSEYHLYLQANLPGRMLIKKGTERGLEVFKGENDRYYTIVGGVEQFTSAQLRGQFIEPSLRVGAFAEPRDIRIVQADVGRDSPLALNGSVFQSLSGNQAPMLVDEQGQLYPPVGYICVEDANSYIGFTPGQPITDLSKLPFTVSRSRAEQDTYLIYRVSGGVKVVAMVADDKVIATWDPELDVPVKNRR